MTDLQTIRTYDQSAEALAEYFKGIGPRVKDVELGLELANAGPGAKVVEIGCGDGRDAAEIVRRTDWYEGFDPSKGLLRIARTRLPNASFVLADALSYEYPQGLDVVFAFASLLHVPKEDMPEVLRKVADALRPDGIFYVSLKERPEYAKETKEDEYGERLFYFYTPNLVREYAGNLFEPVYEDHQTIGSTQWFTMALRKK